VPVARARRASKDGARFGPPPFEARRRRGSHLRVTAFAISPTLNPGYRLNTMLLKFITFIAAAIPIVLFVRSVFFRGRKTRMNEGMKEFKKQVDLAVWIFLALVGCLVAFAAGKLIWTWWTL
jgi:hypothetical protein